MKRAVVAALACLAAAIAFAACAMDWSVPPSADASDATTGDTSADTAAVTDGGPNVDGSKGDALPDSGPDVGTDTGLSGACDPACSPVEICTYPNRDCGQSGPYLVCMPRTTFCGTSQVCGCDHVVYANECAAAAAGTAAGRTSSCDLPPQTFQCADIRFCNAPEVCVYLPTAQDQTHCGSRNGCNDCACLSQTHCGNDAGMCIGLQYVTCYP